METISFTKKSSKLQETKNWVWLFEPEQSDSKDPIFMELLLSSPMGQTEERERTLVLLTGNLRIEGYRTRWQRQTPLLEFKPRRRHRSSWRRPCWRGCLAETRRRAGMVRTEQARQCSLKPVAVVVVVGPPRWGGAWRWHREQEQQAAESWWWSWLGVMGGL